MTLLYPIVLETEASGAVSAYVPGLPVYAAAETHAKAERAIRTVLTAYLEAHPDSRPDARVRVARVSATAQTKVDIVGPAALVGAHRSTIKARASRRAARRSPCKERNNTKGSAEGVTLTRRRNDTASDYQATRNPSTCRSHWSIRFQLVKFRIARWEWKPEAESI